MWTLILLSLFVISTNAQYKTLDDNIKFVPEDAEHVKHHLYCYIDLGPCDEVELSYKQHINHAHLGMCEECNDGQKMMAYTFHTQASQLFPEEHMKFRKMYDLEGNYDAFLAVVAPK